MFNIRFEVRNVEDAARPFYKAEKLGTRKKKEDGDVEEEREEERTRDCELLEVAEKGMSRC